MSVWSQCKYKNQNDESRKARRAELFRLFWAVLAGMSLWMLCFGIARAVDNPDSTSIGEVYIFRSVLETGDQLFYVRYDVCYNATGQPDEVASDTFQLAIYDTDGDTLLYTKPLNYYQINIISRYLTAEQALTWQGEYWVRIMGNPGIFDPLVEGTNMASAQLGPGDYHEGTDLGVKMLAEAAILEDDWGVTLLTASGHLNTTGAFYFTKAIPQLSSMDESIFYQVTYTPDAERTNWTSEYETALHEHQGSRLQTAIQNLATTAHVSEDWMAIFLVGIAYLTTGGAIYAVTRDPSIAVFGAVPVVVGAAWMGVGVSMLTVVIVTMIIAGILFGIHFILMRWA